MPTCSLYGKLSLQALETSERAVATGETGLGRHPNDRKLLEAVREALDVLLGEFETSPAAQRYVPRLIEVSERAFRMQPETVESLMNLGVAYAHAGKIAAANQEDEETYNYLRRHAELPARVVELEPRLRRQVLEAYGKAIEQAGWMYERDARAPSVQLDHAICLGRSAPAYRPGDPAAMAALEKSISMLRLLEDQQSGPALRFLIKFQGSLAERRRQTGQYAAAVRD